MHSNFHSIFHFFFNFNLSIDIRALDGNHYIKAHPESNASTEIMSNTDFNSNNEASGIADGYCHFDESPHSSFSQNEFENHSTSSSASLKMFAMDSKSVAIISDDNGIIPTEKWNDAFYFPEAIKSYAKKIAYKIDTSKAYGWPHIMRGNSLISIGDKTNGRIICLPTVFTSVWVSIET